MSAAFFMLYGLCFTLLTPMPPVPPMRKYLEIFCSLLCASALFAIMALTFFDVLGRKLLSQSIPGSLELTELLMVVVIFAGMPLVSQRGEHVVFDSLDSYLPAWLLKVQGALVHLLCAGLMLGLAYLMWRTGNQFAQNGETTAQLKFAKAPFIYGMALLCGITGLVHFGLISKPAKELQEGEGAAL
jgi:TRAP-type transport system small permease protein